MSGYRGERYEAPRTLSLPHPVSASLGGVSWCNKAAYAAHHDYDLLFVDVQRFVSGTDGVLADAWSRIPALIECLERGYALCAWFDADTAITNRSVSLESLFAAREDDAGAAVSPAPRTPDLVVAKTWEEFASEPTLTQAREYRLNAGVLVVRASAWSLRWLRAVWDMRTRYAFAYNREQSAMQRYFAHNREEERAHVRYVQQERLNIHNAYGGPRGAWRPGMFVEHFYGGMQGCRTLPCVHVFARRCASVL